MNQKHAKVLRAGSKKFNLPYKDLKRAFLKLSPEEKLKFLKDAKISLDLL